MLLGMREKLKRLRQVMLDNGKRPVIWLHTTAKMYPHAFAFADVASDGEAFMFTNPPILTGSIFGAMGSLVQSGFGGYLEAKNLGLPRSF